MKTTLARLRPLLLVLGIAAAALVVWAVFVAPSSPGARELTAEFARVTGLVAHADVTFSGARIGEVAAIDPTPDGRGAILTLTVDDPVDLRTDAGAVVHVKSLLGEMYVAIEPGSEPAPLEGNTIRNTASDLSIDDILHNVAGYVGEVTGDGETAAFINSIQVVADVAADDVDAVLDDAGSLVSTLEGRTATLNSIVANLDLLTASLDGTNQSLGGLIGESARTLGILRESLDRNIAILESALATLENTMATIDASQVSAALATIPDWLVKIDHVLKLLGQLADGDIAIAGEFAALPDASRSADATLQNIARMPLVREALIAQLEAALGR